MQIAKELFPYKLKKRYKKIYQEDVEYCFLIYDLYDEEIALYRAMSDVEFKKLIRNQYNYIKRIEKEVCY